MSIKDGLYTYLTSVGVVTAIAGTRVYPKVIPDQVYDEASKRPCVVYAIDDTERSRTFCGTLGLRRRRITLDSYARTYEAADALSNALETALVDYTGYMGSTYVDQVDLENEFDVDPDLEPGIFRVRQIYSVWHH